ncbi:MAG: 6-phosphogluconolactonase [Bacteroidia bacterium]|nr:6-phosphogluconolactonase [Bacteroidia bacterium]
MSSTLHISQSPIHVAKNVASDIAAMVVRGKPFHIALSGGSTPKLLFEQLAANYRESIPWGDVHLWWGDERCVPPSDEQSNYRMTKESLLKGVILPPGNVHRIKGESDPEEEAKRYASEMAKGIPTQDGLPIFDLVLLGLGTDGHTASIFPPQMDLLTVPEWTAVAIHPESGQQRISITGKVINRARKVAFLVTGESKAEKVSEIFEEKDGSEVYPASHIAPSPGDLIWYIDRAAAKMLRF